MARALALIPTVSVAGVAACPVLTVVKIVPPATAGLIAYVKFSAVDELELVNCTDCDCGVPLFDCELNVKEVGETISSGLVLTNTLTGIVTTLFVTVEAEIWTLPEQVVFVCGRAAVLIDTVTLPGVVVANKGLTTNQLLEHDALIALAIKLTFVPAGLVTERVWLEGARVPICHPKLRLEGATVNVSAPVVDTVTGICKTFAPFCVT